MRMIIIQVRHKKRFVLGGVIHLEAWNISLYFVSWYYFESCSIRRNEKNETMYLLRFFSKARKLNDPNRHILLFSSLSIFPVGLSSWQKKPIYWGPDFSTNVFSPKRKKTKLQKILGGNWTGNKQIKFVVPIFIYLVFNI